MEYTKLKLEIAGGTAVITFCSPETLNALNSQALTELGDAVAEVKKAAAADRRLRALIITGEGKAFVAGADIKEMSSMGSVDAAGFSRFGNNVFAAIDNLPIPVIAAVNGYALGGGLELVLACDFAYAAETAKLGLPETTLGIIPGFGGSKRLADRIGKAAAKELVFTGRMIDTSEALRLRIVNRVVPAESLLDTVKTVVSEISKSSPNAACEVKELLNKCQDNSIEAMTALESNKFGLIFGHPDSAEGQKAFIDKRKPDWYKGDKS